MEKKNFKKKVLSVLIVEALLLSSQVAIAAPYTLSPTPLFLSSNSKPNVLVLFGNSNSMDTDATGAAVGSADSDSKSEISRDAVKSLVTTYSDKINMGLMGYQQSGVVLQDIYNSPYDASYNPAHYDPTYNGPRESSIKKKFRIQNLTDPTRYIYYNLALPSYLPFNFNTTANNKNFYCFTTDNRSRAFSNGEVIVNNNVSDPASGPWLNYNCYKFKTGINNAGPTSTNAAANGYSTGNGLNGAFYPTDSDLAQGATNFGNQLAGTYISPTWFSNISVGKGYIHTPIAALNAAQANKLNTKLGTSQFASNQPTTAAFPLQNAGLSPIAGSVLTAGKYFSGSLTAAEGGPLAVPPSSCGKDFLVMLTDGLPSVLSNGNISYNTDTLLNDLTASATTVKANNSLTTYVVGFALPYGVNPNQLNSIAVAGGSNAPYYAEDSATLKTALNNVFNDIIARSGASSSVALNSGFISQGNKLYQARFNSSDWSGELLSIPLTAAGDLPANLVTSSTWKASATIANRTSTNRTILTSKKSSGLGIPFRWPANPLAPTANELDISQSSALNTNPNTSLSDGLGASRLAFLRGVRTGEGTTFRARSTVLGDIINSSPIIVRSPEATLTNASYIAFKQANATRPDVIYVGSNDGMLHAFKSDTGEEILAYAPKTVFNDLNQLTSTSYSHRYFVDGNPNSGDVYYNGSWKTVLVSGMGAGGRGIFSLDITNPTSFSEANASNIVKFEYNETNDADVGYIIGAPSIVKLNNGKSAAVFGNGYNGTGTGNSALFIVDIETGALIKKISTGVGSVANPNGLANPTPIDVDGNGTVDYVYAGDTSGKMWKFDINNSNPTNWRVAYAGAPLMDTGKPITQQPDVTISPNGGHMVMFGTGKYFEVSDNTTTDTNYFFGLWDNGLTAITGLPQLQAQTVTSATATSRQVSSNVVNYTNKRGWYLTLPTSKERSVTDSIVKGGKVIFTTLTPSSATCAYGGTSWLMALDYLNGNQLSSPIFDTNGDKIIDASDSVTSGIAILGIASAPTILQGLGDINKPLQKIFTNQSTGDVASILNSGNKLSSRRTAWKEVINK